MRNRETILITGANGSLAKKLKKKLVKIGYSVITFTSNKKKEKDNNYFWDIEEKIIDLTSLKKCNHIIHLAGFSILKPWTKKNKQLMYNSRVESSKLLYDLCKENGIKIKTYISASAIGYYDNKILKEMTENDKSGKSWLSNLARDWEEAAIKFKNIGTRVINLRISLLIDKESGFLKKLLPFIKMGVVPMVGEKNNRFEYIDIEDAVNFCIYSIENSEIKGAYNLATNYKLTQYDFLKKFTQYYNKKYLIIKIPSFFLKLLLAKRFEIINSQTKLSSNKIIKSGFEFNFPRLSDTIKKINK